MKDKLTRLLREYDSVIAVLDERVQTRPGLQTPTALDAIRHIRDIRRRLGEITGGAGPDGGGVEIERAGMELQVRVEELEDCAGDQFPRIATNLYGIAEELVRRGRQENP